MVRWCPAGDFALTAPAGKIAAIVAALQYEVFILCIDEGHLS
jgi:hypothetical protein